MSEIVTGNDACANPLLETVIVVATVITAAGVPAIVAVCPSSPLVAVSVRPAGNPALADHVHGSATEHARLLAVNVNGPYAAPTPSVIRPCGIAVGLAAITAAGIVSVVDALLAASTVLPA
jgi:hypothetical protein